MNYIVFFATHWGYVEGGINAFNYDLCMALGRVCRGKNAKVICMPYFDPASTLVSQAQKNNVDIKPLNKNKDHLSLQNDVREIKNKLNALPNIDHLFLIGHDVFTGEIANYMSQEIGENATGIVIHHMDYEAYYAIKGDSTTREIDDKISGQKNILENADHVIAVGPKLKNSAESKVSGNVSSVTPGMQIIAPWKEIPKLIAVTFGRYDVRTDKLKQMGLAAKAFVKFVGKERELSGSDATLKIFGVDSQEEKSSLQSVYQDEAFGYVNIVALPYKKDREELYKELRQCNVSLMLSVHEGFGLVGFESIAAGVPLILSKNSGLYEFLLTQINEEELSSFGIYPVSIKGSNDGIINDYDLEMVVQAICDVRKNHSSYRNGVHSLRDKLREKFTWEHSAEEFLTILSQLLPKKDSESGVSGLDAELPMRLPPTKDTLSALFSLSGNRCAFPGCKHPIFDEEFELVAQVCHIEAALPGGGRFNKKSNNEDRRKIDNLICFCFQHRVKTNDTSKFNVEKLVEIKHNHEREIVESGYQLNLPLSALDKIYEQEKNNSVQLFSLADSSEIKPDSKSTIIDGSAVYLSQDYLPLDESPYKSEIDTILSLKSSAGAKISMLELCKFRDRNWGKLDSLDRFRVLANMGICSLEISEEEKAADLFLESFTFQPDLIKAKGFAALAYTIKRDHANAHKMIKETLAIDPENSDAYQALIHTLASEEENLSAIIERVPQKMRNNTEIAHAFGFVARGKGNLNDAITWFQIALDNVEGNRINALANLASTILETVDGPAFVLNGEIDQDSKNRVNLAIQYFDEAIAENNSPNNDTRAYCFMNRGVAKKFLGDQRGAFEDMIAGNALLDDFATSCHLAIAALEFGAKEQMWVSLHKMEGFAETEQEKIQVELFIGEMDIAEGRVERGLSTLERMLKSNISAKEKDHIFYELISLYTQRNEIAKASKLRELMLAERPESVKTYLTNSQFLLATGKVDEALESVRSAEARVDGSTNPAEILEIANLYRNFSDHKAEANTLEQIANLNVFSGITRQLLDAYFQGGENAKLIEACKQFLETVGPRDVVTEFLSWAYEEIDDLPNAIKVLEDYLALFPNDQIIQARLAFIYYRLTDRENLKILLASIDHIDNTMPMEVQFKLARMYNYIGDEEKFKKFAYEIRRTFYELPAAHDAFVALSVSADEENKELQTDAKMSLDTVALVRNDDTIIPYIIECDEPLFPSRGEIGPESEIAKTLIDKQVGDFFNVGEKEFQIVRFENKFSYAASESLRLLTTTFVSDAKAKKIIIPYNDHGTPDLEAFFAPLKESQGADNYIEDLYKQGKLPIGVIASLKHVSAIRIWAQYISSKELGIITYGHFKELSDTTDMLNAGLPLILDIITITTLSSLKALDDLLLLGNEKIVTQSTLEELYDLIHEQEQSSKTGSFTVGIVDGQYVKQVLSPDTVKGQIKMLEDIANWLKSNCRIVPVTAALSLDPQEKKDMYRAFGKSSIDTILTAKHFNGILYAEETPLRAFAYLNYAIKGCATFIIFQILKDKRLITYDRYSEKMLHLMMVNYKSIAADADILYLAAKNSAFILEPPFTIALDNLAMPSVPEGLDVLEAVKFFKKLYLEKPSLVLTDDNANFIETYVYATMDKLSMKYLSKWLNDCVVRVIDRHFQLIPLHKNELTKLIHNYFSKN